MDWRQEFDADLLRRETRRRQRHLQIVSVIARLVLVLDLVPTRVSPLGVELDKPDRCELEETR
jgi:hypothetical protein